MPNPNLSQLPQPLPKLLPLIPPPTRTTGRTVRTTSGARGTSSSDDTGRPTHDAAQRSGTIAPRICTIALSANPPRKLVTALPRDALTHATT